MKAAKTNPAGGLEREQAFNLVLSTANGEGDPVQFEVDMRVPQLDEEIKALILPETPAVLSIGRRVVDHGYGFHWLPGGCLGL